MKLFLIFALFFSSVNSAFSQDITALIREAEKLEALPDEHAAFTKFKIILKADPNNLHALSKASELCSRLGNRQPDIRARDTDRESQCRPRGRWLAQ